MKARLSKALRPEDRVAAIVFVVLSCGRLDRDAEEQMPGVRVLVVRARVVLELVEQDAGHEVVRGRLARRSAGKHVATRGCRGRIILTPPEARSVSH